MKKLNWDAKMKQLFTFLIIIVLISCDTVDNTENVTESKNYAVSGTASTLNGDAVSYATVYLFPQEFGGDSLPSYSDTVYSDADGSYIFDSIPEGVWSIVGFNREFGFIEQNVTPESCDTIVFESIATQGCTIFVRRNTTGVAHNVAILGTPYYSSIKGTYVGALFGSIPECDSLEIIVTDSSKNLIYSEIIATTSADTTIVEYSYNL